jgi:hypothetical protein
MIANRMSHRHCFRPVPAQSSTAARDHTFRCGVGTRTHYILQCLLQWFGQRSPSPFGFLENVVAGMRRQEVPRRQLANLQDCCKGNGSRQGTTFSGIEGDRNIDCR